MFLAMLLCSATKSEVLHFLKPVSSDQHLHGKQKQRPRPCKVMQVGGEGMWSSLYIHRHPSVCTSLALNFLPLWKDDLY